MSKKNRTKKNKKGGSITAIGTAALLGKAKGLGLGIKSSLKHLGHLGHSAKHGVGAVDDVIIAYHKSRKHGKHRRDGNKNKSLELPQSLDVNEIHTSIKDFGGDKKWSRRKTK